jgi:glycosyltransferase involved in cell wall biosynthesis
MLAVSVVIPVYNAEKYVEKCIESLVQQTLISTEYIFVNDGSTDESLKVLELYQKQDSRIKVVNQLNQGVSAARNAGLHIATGNYIGFVDADDYVAKDMFQKLYETAITSNTDIVASNFNVEQEGVWSQSKSCFPTENVFDKEYIQNEICSFIIQKDDLNSCCTKIFKRNLIELNSILFPVGVTHAEDAMFVLNAFTKAEKVIFIDYSGYYYREVQGSASRDIVSKDYFKNALAIYSLDYKKSFNLILDTEVINKLKAVRFIDTIIALLHIYFKPNAAISFGNKYKYVKKMIHNTEVQKAISYYWDDLNEGANAYKRFILQSIKSKSMIRIMLATAYSNYRNKNNK